MKKLLALILAAALALSLVACGGDSGTGDTNTPSGGADSAKEEMLSNASACDFIDIQSAYNDNKVNAQDTYVGKVYTVTGYVSEIETEYVSIVPLDTPLDYLTGLPVSTIIAYLSTDDIKQLSKMEVINIVGEITSLENIEKIEMKNAYYIDNAVTILGNIDFAIDTSTNQHVMIVETKSVPLSSSTLVDNKCTYSVCSVEETGGINNGNLEEAKIGDITLTEEDTVTIQCKMEYNRGTYSSANPFKIFHLNFTITEIESINKE